MENSKLTQEQLLRKIERLRREYYKAMTGQAAKAIKNEIRKVQAYLED